MTIYESLLAKRIRDAPLESEVRISQAEALSLMRALSAEAMTATSQIRRESSKAIVEDLRTHGRAEFWGRTLVIAK